MFSGVHGRGSAGGPARITIVDVASVPSMRLWGADRKVRGLQLVRWSISSKQKWVGLYLVVALPGRGRDDGSKSIVELRKAHDYEVKPHGLLVSVSLTHYCASTPDLSTWWSATALQGSQAPGRSHLQARFPLRCFQRLSFPYIATQRCLWRDNWYTSGTSTPVLSY